MGLRALRPAHRDLDGAADRQRDPDRSRLQALSRDPGVHDRHRAPAGGEPPGDRRPARPLPGPRPARAAARRQRGRADDALARPEPLPRQHRPPAALLQRAQGPSAEPASRRSRRVDHRASGATSGRAGRTSARSRSTTTTAASSSSTRWPSGPRKRRGTTSASTICPSIRSTRRATRRSAALRARGRSSPARRRATAAGGGSRALRRSAASTARSRAAASSTS